jgi:hypothetical protein
VRRGPPATTADTAFSFSTVPFDAEATSVFVRSAQIAAGIWDDV